VPNNYPESLLYTKDHEWCRIEGDVATVGITWHAQNALGDVVYCELPEVGSEVKKGETFGVVESVKAVSDLYAPLTGSVTERNEAVIKSPETINSDSYGQGWMIKVRIKDKAETKQLMSPSAYVTSLDEGE
jgi:glycine cleavage system H protein